MAEEHGVLPVFTLWYIFIAIAYYKTLFAWPCPHQTTEEAPTQTECQDKKKKKGKSDSSCTDSSSASSDSKAKKPCGICWERFEKNQKPC